MNYSRLLSTSVATPLFVLFSILIYCSGCSDDSANNQTAAPLPVVIVKVKKQDVPTLMEFVGQTKGAIDAEIRARVEGVLTGIHFEEGKEVTEGQLLYTIDPAPFNAKVAEIKGNLAAAETRLVKARSDVGRYRPLAQMKAVSEKTLDSAVAEEGAASGAVDAAKASLESAEIELSYTKITSPTSGVIGMSKAKIGEFVGRSPNPIVLNTVSSLDEIHVKFSVTEQEYLKFARLRRDQLEAGAVPEKRELELILADGSIHPDKGEVAYTEREVDATTGTLAVEARFPNPHRLIRPGQYAKVRANIGTKKDALLIPKKAVVELQGQYSAYLVTPDNRVEQRTLTLGGSFQEMQIIDAGLLEGDAVVVEGVQRLRPGMAVNPKTVEQSN